MRDVFEFECVEWQVWRVAREELKLCDSRSQRVRLAALLTDVLHTLPLVSSGNVGAGGNRVRPKP